MWLNYYIKKTWILWHTLHTFSLYLWVCSGPDICGPGTKKVHVIFNYKGKNHLINKDIRCKVRYESISSYVAIDNFILIPKNHIAKSQQI